VSHSPVLKLFSMRGGYWRFWADQIAIRFREIHSRCRRFSGRVQAVSEGMSQVLSGHQLTVRTAHARNRIRRACQMRNCWNCRNGYSQIQRIGSNRRSKGVIFAIQQYHYHWMSGGAEGDRGRRKQGSTKAGSSHIGILR
jgi:hypothetical protein